ncbi:hypothetical protein GS429_04625 [Natronorubrum sp. JWXQ-INN-674]|uniref:Uncharacterized protein n=1 Tax=Natronorubrum halalkaliphilum TaxID=2691917 RepID=A0A6B0VLA5_9EURY|nr:hypothetical protein [Natronorubrum halalkaliphilum]MXV61359.1 hypothetical protein [Natronorubrum halalkaliphilum]
MNRTTPVLLAAVLVSSLLAMPVIAAGPEPTSHDVGADDPTSSLPLHQLAAQQPPAEADGTTNRLPLEPDRAGHTEYGTDIGLALASVDDELRVDHEQYTLIDSEFATASADEREEMVRAAYNQIKDRTEQLEEREREAVRDHAAGELTDTELIQTLLRNQNEAAKLYDALVLTDDRADQIDGYSLVGQQTRADRTILEYHQTSIRSTLEQASQSGGASEQTELLIQTSENGYSLSMIDGDMYERETVRFDNRRVSTAPNQFEDSSHSETMDHAAEHYPWAGIDQGWSGFRDSGNENLYRMTMEVDQNHLEIHLDGGTGEVYREEQELSLESLPEESVETWTDDEDELELELVQTPANGPAAVTVNDTATDEPVGATITIDGVDVGHTDDGTLWIVPPNDEYELRAETSTGTVNATITGN